jgi:glycerol-3-phosphate acyltransferase PlsY
MTTQALFLVLAYLVGSFPSGLVIGKFGYHVDLRDYGSHNIGATNAYRVLGKVPAFMIFFLDALKGAAGVYLGSPDLLLMLAGGIAAIAGHSCSVFLKFKGGRGVATGLGVIACLVPTITAIVFVIWAVIVYFTKLVSLGSIVAASFVPILMYAFGKPPEVILFGIAAALFVIIRHKDNIHRLLQGKELKVERIKK